MRTSSRLRRCALLPLLLVLALPVGGQEEPVAERPFLDRIEVRAVDIDVVVTDSQGNPIVGLRREDFELYEDGREVDITYFTPVVEGFVRPSALPAGEETVTLPSELPQGTALTRAPLTWAVFLDDARLKPGQRNEALRQLSSFLQRTMRPGDRAAVGAFDGLRFRVLQPLTTDHDVLIRQLAELEGQRFEGSSRLIEEMNLRVEMQTITDPDPLVEGRRIGSAIEMLVEASAERTRHAVGALDTYMDLLAGQEGRLAMVYLGSGFETLPSIGLTELWRRRFPSLAEAPESPRPEDHQRELQPLLAKLYTRISAGRTAFYAINGAVDSGASLGPEDGGFIDTDVGSIGNAGLPQEQGSVRELAQRSGGRYFTVNPQLREQLTSLGQDVGNYYSLGYVPTGEPSDYRRLRVEVLVPGARVRHRQAVVERTPDEQAEDSVVTALFADPGSNPLGVTVETGTVEKSGRGRVVPARVLIPLRGLTLLPEGASHRGDIALHFAMAQPDGTVWRLAEREIPLNIPAEQIEAAVAQQHITYSVGIPVVADDVKLAVAVQDRVSGARSIVTIPITGRPRRGR
jgi:VWFA-related protein